jgi:hypothetical protein
VNGGGGKAHLVAAMVIAISKFFFAIRQPAPA